MNILERFEEELLNLDPAADEYLHQIDMLLVGINEEYYENLIPSIFKFFEKNSLSDCGTPGTLVHLVEVFYPIYLPQLIDSINKKPSYNAILMVNRLLNSELSNTTRIELMYILKNIASNSAIAPMLQKESREFIEYQNEKNN